MSQALLKRRRYFPKTSFLWLRKTSFLQNSAACERGDGWGGRGGLMEKGG